MVSQSHDDKQMKLDICKQKQFMVDNVEKKK